MADFTSISLVIATNSTTTIARILEIHASFARNQTADPTSIHKRNKALKKLDLRLKTSIDLQIKLAGPVTSRDDFLVHIYSIWPNSRVKTIAIKTN